MGADGGDHSLGMIQNLGVCEADDGPAKRLEFSLPQMIAQDHLVETMHASVDLEDQAEPVAREVRDVGR